jgi:hypothetical protein
VTSAPTTSRDVDRELAVQHYEQLRGNVLSHPRQYGSALGEAIVMRHGLAAWIEHAGERATAPPPLLPPGRNDEDLALPAAVHSELLCVLANLVLTSHLVRETSS